MTLVLGDMTSGKMSLRRLDRLPIWLLRNTARAARQQTAYSMVSSPCGRHLKGKGKGFWAWEKCEDCTRKDQREGFQHLPGGCLYAKTVVLWLLAGISLPPSLVFLLHLKTPFPLKCLPHGLSDISQSVYLFTLFNIYQAISIFWWLELRYELLDHWMHFWY